MFSRLGLCIALLATSLTAAFAAEQPILTPEKVLNGFPLCQIRSSVGPRCKSFSEEQRKYFTPSKIKNQSSFELEPNGFRITTEYVDELDDPKASKDGWHYGFRITTKKNRNAIVTFSDDGIKGTYHVVSDYEVKWDSNARNWYIIGEKLIYMWGNEDDKKDKGRYIPYPDHIPFVLRK